MIFAISKQLLVPSIRAMLHGFLPKTCSAFLSNSFSYTGHSAFQINVIESPNTYHRSSGKGLSFGMGLYLLAPLAREADKRLRLCCHQASQLPLQAAHPLLIISTQVGQLILQLWRIIIHCQGLRFPQSFTSIGLGEWCTSFSVRLSSGIDAMAC